MDQYIACYGEEGNALLLDCRSLTHKLIPIPADLSLVICNTMVKHDLAISEYNARRADCKEAVQRISSLIPDIRALRDVSQQQLELCAKELTPLLYRRACHVVTENDRTLRFARALESGDSKRWARSWPHLISAFATILKSAWRNGPHG